SLARAPAISVSGRTGFAVLAEAAVGLVDRGLDSRPRQQLLAFANLENFHLLASGDAIAYLGILLIDPTELHFDRSQRIIISLAAHEDVAFRSGRVDRRQRDGQRVIGAIDQHLALHAHAGLKARRRLIEREIDRVFLGVVPP